MLISSSKLAFQKKNNLIGNNGIELNQFMNNSFGFYLDSNGLEIKDLSKDIESFNVYINKVNIKTSESKLDSKKLEIEIETRRKLNYEYFKKFQLFLNSELRIAKSQKKISDDVIKKIIDFTETERKYPDRDGSALDDIDSVFPNRTKGAMFEQNG